MSWFAAYRAINFCVKSKRNKTKKTFGTVGQNIKGFKRISHITTRGMLSMLVNMNKEHLEWCLVQ